MKSTVATLIGLLVVICSARAQDGLGHGPPRAVDHLTPVDPYKSPRLDKYAEYCHAILKVDELESQHEDGDRRGPIESVVIVRRPAFDAESCVAVRRNVGRDSGELIRNAADRNLWYALNREDDPAEPSDAEEEDGAIVPQEGRDAAPAGPVEITTIRLSIDAGRAARIIALVELGLNGTRYPDSDAGAYEDSCSYEFRSRTKHRYGEAQEPAGGQAALLIRLENALETACASGDEGRDAALARIDRICDAWDATTSPRAADASSPPLPRKSRPARVED